MAKCNRIPVSPLQYIATDPWYTFGSTQGSCARISPNCQHKLEFLVETLTSLLDLASGAEGACATMALPKMQLDKYHDGAYPLWIEMCSKGDNVGLRAARASSSTSG